MRDFGLPQLAEFLSEFWEFEKKHYKTTDWQGMVNDANRLLEKYSVNLTKEIVLAAIHDIEMRARRRNDYEPVRILYERNRS